MICLYLKTIKKCKKKKQIKERSRAVSMFVSKYFKQQVFSHCQSSVKLGLDIV